MKNTNQTSSDTESRNLRSFFVIIRDRVFDDPSEEEDDDSSGCFTRVIQASSHLEAEHKVIEMLNAEIELRPDEDGGYLVISVFDKNDFQELADQLAEEDKKNPNGNSICLKNSHHELTGSIADKAAPKTIRDRAAKVVAELGQKGRASSHEDAEE